MRLKIYYTVTVLLLTLTSMAVTGSISSYAALPVSASPHIWTDVSASSLSVKGIHATLPAKYRVLDADETSLRALLASAPLENATSARNSNAILDLPMPDGSAARYRVVESPVMEPGLAAKFPDIKTYLAQGVEDRTAMMRLDFTPSGFHAMATSTSGTVLVEPYTVGDTTHYVSYYKQDYQGSPYAQLSPPLDKIAMMQTHTGKAPQQSLPFAPPSGPNLRTYRLAMAATGEYTQASGGTVASAMAEIVTLVNRLNQVYEREVAIRMVLVNNNDQLVYTDPATDPYGKSLMAENQANIDKILGTGSYDIGHLVTKGEGGVAYVGVVCNAKFKAQGESGGLQLKGDPFYIDLVAHEIGHQFNGAHSFNGTTGSCSGRDANHAWEPGSGSTIMAYAGTCGDENLQKSTDPYFHTGSYDDIINYVNNPEEGGSCGTSSPTLNNPPAIGVLQNYVIPANTYFALTGSATGPDGDPLTYSWEEFDLGTQSPPSGDDGSRPIFRSFPPSLSATRYFPKLQDILTKNDGSPSFGEWLPTTNRTLKFRFTARDNRAGGGGVNYGQASVQVIASQNTTTFGPFRVTAPNTAVFWEAGSQQPVTWNVANTDQAPVSCANVNILLSVDGGQTFPTTLAANTANDGNETVNAPTITSTSARVEVVCAGNIFFDTSNVDFTIGDPNVPPPTPPATATATATATTPPSQEEYVTQEVQPGGTVTTEDSDNNGASASDPVETTLESPNAGIVKIIEGRIGDDTGGPGSGGSPAKSSGRPSAASPSATPETFFGQQVTIQAPTASAANPMKITFWLDSSIVPVEQDQLTVDIYKDEILVPDCASQSGSASPDPCVYSRTLYQGDDAEITVLSSSSGSWNYDEGSTTCSTQFNDVDASNAFITFIECLACRDVIGGYGDGTFRPGNLVTRGQISKIVANALGLPGPASGQTFEDVKPTGQPNASPFYEYIEFLTRARYMGGYTCEDPATHPGTDIPCVPGSNRPYFRPGANATRGQISKIVSNAANFQDPPTGQTFTDVPANSPFYTWIQRLASRGYISGYACGGTNPETGSAEPCDTASRPWFRPNNSVTRGQTTKIAANAILPDCAIPPAPSRK